jgi:hypothetical protein
MISQRFVADLTAYPLCRRRHLGCVGIDRNMSRLQSRNWKRGSPTLCGQIRTLPMIRGAAMDTGEERLMSRPAATHAAYMAVAITPAPGSPKAEARSFTHDILEILVWPSRSFDFHNNMALIASAAAKPAMAERARSAKIQTCIALPQFIFRIAARRISLFISMPFAAGRPAERFPEHACRAGG